MPSLNRVQLIGRLGKDPDVRTTPNGKKVSTFSLAVDHRWRTGEGEVKGATDWFNIEAWGRLGQICQQYLHKGSLVYLEGRLHTDRYEHEGSTKYFTKVILRQMQMLEPKAAEEEPVLEEEPEID